jgi:hypothetical protein
MANNLTTNPIQIDTVGTIMGGVKEITVSGIKVVPSGTTWTCILKDGRGNIVFHDTNNKAGKHMPLPFTAQGLKADTLTSITRVLLYLAPGK